MKKAGTSLSIYWEGEKIAKVTEINITFDRTFWVAYMGRMYAEMYRN